MSVFTRWPDNNQYAASYLFITHSQKVAVDAVGSMPVGSLDIIEQVLLQSPKFKMIYSNQDAKIFFPAKMLTNKKDTKNEP